MCFGTAQELADDIERRLAGVLRAPESGELGVVLVAAAVLEQLARDVDFGAETVRVVEELAALSEQLTCRVEDGPPGVARFPAVLVRPEGKEVGLRYYGLPWGYELASIVGAVLEAGRLESSLSPKSLERLAGLEQDLALDVFVTPT